MSRRQLPVILALGTAQTLAWASSVYLPAILADPPGAILFYPRDIHAISKQVKGIPPLPYRESLQYAEKWSRS